MSSSENLISDVEENCTPDELIVVAEKLLLKICCQRNPSICTEMYTTNSFYA